jgi:cytoskeletal protein RodZ
MKLTLLAATLTLAALPLAASNFAYAQDTTKPTAKQDIKKAGADTKDATKKTGHAIAKSTKTAAKKTKAGTKKVVHSAAKGTAKTADKVEDKTAPH